MDLQALTTQQLELSLKLADILSMEDLTVAAAVLSSFNWNIQKAVQELQIGPTQQNKPNPPDSIPKKPSNSEDYTYKDFQNVDEYEQEEEYSNELDEYEYLIKQKKQMFEEEYVSLIPLQKTVSQPNKEYSILQQHKNLARDHRTHKKQYLQAVLDNSEVLCKKILDSNKEGMNKYYENKRKVQNNRNFINYLYKTYHPKVNFTFGTFFLNLTRSYLEDKFLLVYIHSVAPEVQNKFQKIVELILKQKEISKFINDNCITYGMFDNSDDYELIQKYIPLKDLPAFALFRLNKNKRAEELISIYKISSQGQIFLEWAAKSMGIGLKKKVNSGIQQEKVAKEALQQAEMKKKKEQELSEALIKKQIQYIAHRDIRKQQDQLYAELQKTYIQKKQLSYDRKETVKTHEEQLSRRKEEVMKWVQPEIGPTVIEIRFRMPLSGESKLRRFQIESKVEKMYEYVDALYRDEFQQKFADFDLRQSFPPLSLMDKKDKTINQVFEGSNRENIIIRQL